MNGEPQVVSEGSITGAANGFRHIKVNFALRSSVPRVCYLPKAVFRGFCFGNNASQMTYMAITRNSRWWNTKPVH